jgi:hypothetical protein
LFASGRSFTTRGREAIAAPAAESGRESLGRFGGSCGANVLSALGLLWYTEFAGRLKRDDMSHNWIEPATQVRVCLIPSPRATS